MNVQINISSKNLDKATVRKLLDMFEGRTEEPAAEREAITEERQPQKQATLEVGSSSAIEELANTARVLLRLGARDDLKALLAKFKVVSIKDLKEEQRISFMECMQALKREYEGKGGDNE